MTILEAAKVTKAYGTDTVLQGISLKINQGEKVGLIGENGSGKSTLLKMIAGIEDPSEGALIRPRWLRIGYQAQSLAYGPENTVHKELWSVFDSIRRMGAELERLEVAMSATEDGGNGAVEKAMAEYGRLLPEFERLGGYTCDHRIEAVMEGLGISGMRDRRVESLSGGEKNVVALAKILLEEPDVLLLDEPGNHLDFEGLAWLERFIRDYGKTVVLVSHDRYLLDRTVERILEIEDRRVASYAGNYSTYRVEKMRALLKQKAAYEDQQKEIRRLEEMIKRFELWAHMVDNPRHARQARNKQKMLDKMDKIDRPNMERRRIDPRFDMEERSGRITLELKGYSRAFGERVLFDGVGLLLSSGDRAGLLGANGTGKTTLFKDILAHGAWENPNVRVGPKTRIGYYSQEHETLDPSRTVLEDVRWEKGLSKSQAFTILSRFLFRWEDMDRRVETLSGGEKGRLQLAKLMTSDANLLLLDEPTNHLDIASREQVEEALETFDGAILAISHDRYFLDRIVDRIVEVKNPDLIEHVGNFSAYWEKRRAERLGTRTKPKRTRPARKSKRPPRPTAGADEDDIERTIDGLEAERLKAEQAVADAYRDRDYKKGERLTRQLRELETKIEKLFEAL